MQRIFSFGELGLMSTRGLRRHRFLYGAEANVDSLTFNQTFPLQYVRGPATPVPHLPVSHAALLVAVFMSPLKSLVIRGPAGFPLLLGPAVNSWPRVRGNVWCRHTQAVLRGFAWLPPSPLPSEALPGTSSGIPVGKDGQVGLWVPV